MQIPLDYYRILGLPIQATTEQLQQAHRDRTLQLPKRDYSELAIAARKRLLDEAYGVLTDADRRQAYNAHLLPHALDLPSDLSSTESSLEEPAVIPSDAPDLAAGSPSLEVAPENLIGALLILLELGEYELVLSLGRPYCDPAQVKTLNVSQPQTVFADILLTISLACLELGREQWKQGHYENAAESLSIGLVALQNHHLFPELRQEIQVDLYKLRPYQILELLALPESEVAERQRGLHLLQTMLDERQGIDGKGEDYSGLSTDDFLRFIQQLREYLTVAEQQTLFEAEAQRPSAVARYLLVYALLAQGFSQKQPSLIRQAKQLLSQLNNRQDVYLEQAVCALLLGQTEVAFQALDQSKETETLQFIRSSSLGAPDLLPGLCLYSEQWLQKEVFPYFRDLSQQKASLQAYFADSEVQAYLEALLDEVEGVERTSADGTTSHHLVVPYNHTKAPGKHAVTSMAEEQPATITSSREDALVMPVGAVARQTAAFTEVTTFERTYPSESSSRQGGVATLSPPVATAVRGAPPQPLNVRQSSRLLHIPGTSRSIAVDDSGARTWHLRSQRKRRLPLGPLAAIWILGLLAALGYQAFNQLFQIAAEPVLKGEQLLVGLDRPPVEIPDPTKKLIPVTSATPSLVLTKQSAQQTVENWLAAKRAAMGPKRQVEQLQTALTGPMLSVWQQKAQQAKAEDWYLQYQHTLVADTLTVKSLGAATARVDVEIREVAQKYDGGQLVQAESYDDLLLVRYELVFQQGQWRIRDVQVLQQG